MSMSAAAAADIWAVIRPYSEIIYYMQTEKRAATTDHVSRQLAELVFLES